MRLLFDDKIGSTTFERLRAEVLRSSSPAEADRTASKPPRRIIAAGSGAVLGLVALLLAAPSIRSRDTRSSVVEPARETASVAPIAPPPAPASPAAADLARAKRALAEGRGEEAVAAFESAFALDPSLRTREAKSYAAALTREGRQRFEEGADGAADKFAAAIEADRDAFDAHFYLAKIHTQNSDPEAAAREYLEALRIEPRSADAQFNLGYIYFSQKRFADALRHYEAALELRPPYLVEVFYNVSACYERLGRTADAIAALRRGLEVDPGSELLRQRLKRLGGEG